MEPSEMREQITSNPIAASLASPDTRTCLADLERLAPKIGMAEVRLDLMHTFDIERLVAASPVPLIMTCRPKRERGNYDGPETGRLAILRRAYECECAYIDVEADSLDAVSGWRGSPTQIIASQHWFDRMPRDLGQTYLDLRDRCDVVKLAGMAESATDVLPLLGFMRDATTSVIGMAMGELGTCTRILSPTFRHSLLTYGSASTLAATASGQVTVDELADTYKLPLVNAATKVYIHITSTDNQFRAVLAAQERVAGGTELHVSLRTESCCDTAALADSVRRMLPGAEVVAA
jgi:3-dehydroquinate dehydratase type I